MWLNLQYYYLVSITNIYITMIPVTHTKLNSKKHPDNPILLIILSKNYPNKAEHNLSNKSIWLEIIDWQLPIERWG